MPVAASTSTPHDARNLELGMLLIGAGAVLLLISLFLAWYQPGIDAWQIFEVWDLVLAVLAIVVLVAVASRMGFGPLRPSSWLVGPAVAALVIVLYAILNPPPLTRGIDGDPDTGLWLALAASVLMAAGAVLSVARISVAFTAAGPTADPAAPRRGGRFARRDAATAAGEPVDPDAPGARAVPPTEPTRRL
ncbi:MAG: hypothetical protein WKF42_09160 [Solirubrobacteraceae bacterium]